MAKLSNILTARSSQGPSDNFKNLIINGDMQVAQRNTSVASLTTSGYRTVDRFGHNITTLGTWTMSQENDAPTGSGFRKSTKVLCTTADASPAAGDYSSIYQIIEGQNLQHIKKGTASAEQLTLSFWVKSNVTGTYIATLYDNDNTRSVSKSYTINASGTWERKVITFSADTTGAFDNDNNGSLILEFVLGSGTDRTSGTLQTTWGSYTAANYAAGQVNLASAISNYWQVTGVQLEVGDTATPFEFKTFAQDLKECQRYYYRLTTVNSGDALTGFGECYGTTNGQTVSYAPQIMRATATTVDYANIGWIIPSTGSGSITSLTIATTGTIGNVIFLGAATGSGMSGGKVFYIRSTSAGGYIGIGCEL